MTTIPPPGSAPSPAERIARPIVARAAAAAGVLCMGAVHGAVVTFEELSPTQPYGGPGGGFFENGANLAGGFEAGGIRFGNAFDPEFGSWSGWAFSTVADTETAGFANQWSAWPGGGSGGSATFAVAYDGNGYGLAPTASLVDGGPFRPLRIDLANTTYTALAIRDGDAFTMAFGGPDGTDPDRFSVAIAGFRSGLETGRVEVDLADYRPPDSADDVIAAGWSAIDLGALGVVDEIRVSFASTDVGPFGVTTPTYAAFDGFEFERVAVPEPGPFPFAVLAAAVFALRRRRPSNIDRLAPGGRRSRLRPASGALAAALALTAPGGGRAGPYPGAAGQPGSDAVRSDDTRIVGWAETISSYDPGPGLVDAWRFPDEALGPAEGDTVSIVSLGRGGSITLAFAHPIGNGPGPDFAVFENAFRPSFLELAFVDVSPNGRDFLRFPTHSLTGGPVGAFDLVGVDPTDVDGFAGKHVAGFGTPFDLDRLGLDQITHVRLVDVVGDGSATDSQGNPVHDPFPTAESAGFDLDGVAALHGPGTSFAAWAARSLPPGTPSAPGEDPDRDRRSNLLEYGIGGDPVDAADRPPLDCVVEGEAVTLGFRRMPARVDAILRLEARTAGPVGPWEPVAESRGGNPVEAVPAANASVHEVPDPAKPDAVVVTVVRSRRPAGEWFRIVVDLAPGSPSP